MSAAPLPAGCLGRLLWLPRLLLFPRRPAAAALTGAEGAGLTAEERAAVGEARQAAARTLAHLHRQGRLVDPAVLDQIGGGVARLQDAVTALAEQLAEARAWSAHHSPARLQEKQTALELEDGPGFVARQQALRALREESRLAAQVAAELPALSAQLRAAASRLTALEARLQRDALRQDADQTAHHLATLEAETQRDLSALAATLAELRALP